jgi:hypothetical protein
MGTHTILAVETIDGDAFIIDTAGAQFGQHHTVVPMKIAFIDYGFPAIRLVQRHGNLHATTLTCCREILAKPGSDARAIIMQAWMIEAFDKYIGIWERARQTTMSVVLNGPRYEFDNMESGFLNSAQHVMAQAHDSMGVGVGVSVIDILSKLQQTQQFPEIRELVLNNKREGSSIRQMWITQQKNKLRKEQPEKWEKVYEPQLAKGGSVKVPIQSGSWGDVATLQKAEGTLSRKGYAASAKAPIQPGSYEEDMALARAAGLLSVQEDEGEAYREAKAVEAHREAKAVEAATGVSPDMEGLMREYEKRGAKIYRF